MVKSNIFNSGSGRGARGGLVLANPSRGESAIRPRTQPSISATVATRPGRAVGCRLRKVVRVLSDGCTADVADSEQLYVIHGG